MASRLATIIVAVIVSATLVAGLIVRAQRDDEGPVDLIVFNGRVFTGDDSGAFQEAIAVRGNRILRVGSNREIKRLRRAQTTVVDAHGGAVVPGFNDSHMHFLSGSLGLDEINLLDAKTLEDIQATIRTYAEAHPDREWVLGRGWFYAPFPGGLPTRQLLDALVPDRPAYITCYDGHTAWANTKALKLAGITRRTKNPKNGIIVKDPRTGEPTGVLKESAQDLMNAVLPQPTREDKLQGLRNAIRLAHRYGLTSIQNASGNAEELELYDEIRRSGDLDLRVYSALSIEPGFSVADADAFDALWRRFPDDPLLKTGAVKLMADGVIEAHTAAMLAAVREQSDQRERELLGGRAQPDRPVDGRAWLADHDPRHRRQGRAHGARRLRAGLDGEPGARAWTPPSHRAYRDHRSRRRSAFRATRRDRGAAAAARNALTESDQRVGGEHRARSRLTRLGLAEHRRGGWRN